jgi:hypothetical protein
LSRFIAVLTTCLLVAASNASASSVSTWSMSGHDAHDTSFNPDETALGVGNVRLLHVVWSVAHVSSAIATDSRVYVIRPLRFASSQVAVLYAADGKNLFVYTPAMLRLQRGAFDTPMALAHPDDTLVVANTREIVALNPHNGRLRQLAGRIHREGLSEPVRRTGIVCTRSENRQEDLDASGQSRPNTCSYEGPAVSDSRPAFRGYPCVQPVLGTFGGPLADQRSVAG